MALTPEGRRKQDALAAEIKDRVERFKQEQRELLCELREAGVIVDMVNLLPMASTASYIHTLPILARHIGKRYSQGTLESLARSMAVPEAGTYWDELVELYKQQPAIKPSDPGDFSMGLAAAIAASWPSGRLDELVSLLKDPTLRHRSLLLTPLKRRRARNPRIAAIVEELRHDPVLAVEINSWKGKRSSTH